MIGIVLKVSRRMAKGLEGYKQEHSHELLTTLCTVMFLPRPLTQPCLQCVEFRGLIIAQKGGITREPSIAFEF